MITINSEYIELMNSISKNIFIKPKAINDSNPMINAFPYTV